MKTMKKLVALFMMLVLCVGVMNGCGGTSDDSQVVAKVGDEVITVGELKYTIEVIKMQSVGQLQGDDVEEFWNTDKDGKDAESYIREKAMELLIDVSVMAQTAKDNDLSISADEINKEFTDNAEALQQTMDTYGVSKETLKAVYRKQMLYSKYGERVLAVSERFNPSDDVLKEVFAKNFYKAQHILVMTIDQTTGQKLPQEQLDAKKAEIEALLKQAKGGADFQALMMEHSEDPGKDSAPDGYVFSDGEMVTEFYEGTAALEENGISDIIESSYGYHIIKRIPLDMEADFTANIGKAQNFYMIAEEDKVLEELKATMEITQDDAKINAVAVR